MDIKKEHKFSWISIIHFWRLMRVFLCVRSSCNEVLAGEEDVLAARCPNTLPFSDAEEVDQVPAPSPMGWCPDRRDVEFRNPCPVSGTGVFGSDAGGVGAGGGGGGGADRVGGGGGGGGTEAGGVLSPGRGMVAIQSSSSHEDDVGSSTIIASSSSSSAVVRSTAECTPPPCPGMDRMGTVEWRAAGLFVTGDGFGGGGGGGGGGCDFRVDGAAGVGVGVGVGGGGGALGGGGPEYLRNSEYGLPSTRGTGTMSRE